MEYVFRLYSKTRIWEQDIASDGAVMRVGSGEGDRLRVPAELLPPAAFEVRVAAAAGISRAVGGTAAFPGRRLNSSAPYALTAKRV